MLAFLSLVPMTIGVSAGQVSLPAPRDFHAAATTLLLPLDAVENELLRSAERRFFLSGTEPPARDAAIIEACREAADALSVDIQSGETTSDDGATPSELLRASLEHAGVTDATTYPFTLRTVDGRAPIAQMQALIEAHVLHLPVTHVGVGVSSERLADGERVITLVFVRRLVDLNPMPRELPLGTDAELTGRIPEDAGFPQVLLATPAGRVVALDVYAGDRLSFSCPIAFEAGPGEYMVEVLVDDVYGAQVANLFPVSIGTSAPRLPVVRLLPPDPPGLTERALAARLLRLINRSRARFGLGPLRHDETLSRAARSHSSDMTRRGYFGHRGPTEGSAAERLLRFGMRPSLVSETISIAPSTANAHAGLMRSPSHRRALLDRRMTHIGIGVLFVGDGPSRRLVITAELARLP